MIYSRIIAKDNNLDESIKQLNLNKKSDFAFYDLIYLNRNGASITEDTLKIRVYQKTEWDTKNVLVIRKTAPVINGVKEDKVLLREEFDTVEEALNFVNKNLSNEYEYKLKLEKTGVEYNNDGLSVWIENIKDVGTSIEFGSESSEIIENAISSFDVVERLYESVPEYLYKKYLNKQKEMEEDDVSR